MIRDVKKRRKLNKINFWKRKKRILKLRTIII